MGAFRTTYLSCKQNVHDHIWNLVTKDQTIEYVEKIKWLSNESVHYCSNTIILEIDSIAAPQT